MSDRTSGILLIGILAAAGCLIVGLAASFVLAGAWLVAGTPSPNWLAVAAIASVASAIGTAATLGAIAIAAQSFRHQIEESARRERRDAEADRSERERARAQMMPYVRVDIAFLELREPNFTPRDVRHVLQPAELGIEDELAEALHDALAEFGAPSYQLILWLQNLQTAPLGIADQVRCRLEIAWRVAERDDLRATSLELEVAYLAAGQCTAILLGRIRRDVHHFLAELDDEKGLFYVDMFGNASSDRHGALRLVYDRNTGVHNVRRRKRHQGVFEDEARS